MSVLLCRKKEVLKNLLTTKNYTNMLPQEQKTKLDGIVQTMIDNDESDSNIRFIIDDFKKKYSVIETPAPKKDLLQKTGDIFNKIFPGKQVGEAIGTLGGYIASPNKEQFDISAPSPLQVGADVASGALNVAGFKGAGIVGTFGQRVLKMAGLSAGIAGTETLKEGGSAVETVKSAALGGAVGGAIPVIGAGLRAIGRQIETLPARFVNSALSRNKAQVLQDISKDKVDDFANYVLKSKPVGTANKLLDESVNSIDDLSKQINASLSSSVRQT